MTMEFELDPHEAGRLIRAPAVLRLRDGRARAQATKLVWHDTAIGELAATGIALGEQRGRWRLERMIPAAGEAWPPATPAPILCEASSATKLPASLPAPLMPVAAFSGRTRTLMLKDGEEPLTLTLTEGALHALTREQATCRVRLSGPPVLVATLATRLFDEVPLRIPRAGLPAQAIAFARGTPAEPRRLGTPALPSGLTVADALALVCGHLADVVLHWAGPAAEGRTPDPVHQMRVAVRRLRSALSVFARAAGGPSLDQLKPLLKDLAARLGAARDWDVFLGGTGAAAREALGDDRRLNRLLAAAERKRLEAYRALRHFLATAEFRRLELQLALLAAVRPWQIEASEDQAALLLMPAEVYASKVLDRRWTKMTAVGPDLSALPIEALHELRKEGKRLRYAAEFFAPLHPGKAARKFLDHLSVLQEHLGELNDGAVAAGLMGQLGGGRDRSFAMGTILGFSAARGLRSRARIASAWRKFIHQDTFW